MVPNPGEIHNHVNNPAKNAAIHFGAFLQQKSLLQETDNLYGSIEQTQLYEQFSNHYQPCYKSCLMLSDLLATLRRYGVAKKKSRRRNGPQALVHILKHPNPTEVPPPSFILRPRLYVDQNRIMRDHMVHSEVFNETNCKLCNESFFNEQSKIEHVESDLHTFRLQYREKRSSFKDVVQGGRITDSEDNSNGEIVLRIGETRHVTINVSLEDSYDSASIFEIIKVDGVRADPLLFHGNMPIQIKVSAVFSEHGAYIYPLVAKVMPARICLMKELIFRVGSELTDQLAPTSPYKHHQNVSIHEMEGSIVPGDALKKNEFKLIQKVLLGNYEIPSVYNKLLLNKLKTFDNMTSQESRSLDTVLMLLCGQSTYQEALQQISQTKAPYTSPLNRTNYIDRFHLLIDLEEMQEQKDIRNYDRKDQTLKRQNTKLFLEVADLSEGRPSVTRGDRVHIKCKDGENKKVIYEGIIHEMHEHGLLLGLNNMFLEEYKALENKGIKPKVDVRFIVNRFPKLNMHRALKLLKKHNSLSIVFPELRGTYFPPTSTPTLRPWDNPLIGNNPEQQRAVRNIISKTSDSAPYLIFGPPGTGKTVTLVETIIQVWYANQTQTHKAKQLVCAPSNEACNNVAKSLVSRLPRTAKILRLFSLSLEAINVPECLYQHSNYDRKSRGFFMPTIEEITDNDIIVVTIVSAGRLVTGGAAGLFRYVYIDECGQATEPEALIAIAGILTTRNCPSTGQLVLAGDPQQLGPILSSTLSKDFGLGVSLLERLMTDNALYKKKEDGTGYDPKYLTKLVQNFRSHEAILRIPNKLFYDNELQSRGNKDIINKAVGWKELPNKEFPLIFHGVHGIDERESNSPSYFNRQEIDVVIDYMKKLLNKGLPNYKVKHEDIGVITPYRKQVKKFAKLFDHLGWNISVGSVEQFQGSEKLIIFISTVRSSAALIDEDYRFKLGFLKNPKRFNVSVTRAKALLVVVGNPKILRHDKQWHQLLKYCYDNGAYRGIKFPIEDPPDYQPDHIAS